MLQVLYYVIWYLAATCINRTQPEQKHKSNNINWIVQKSLGKYI